MARTAEEVGYALNGATTDETHEEFLTFLLGEESYAVDILRVREIRAWESATRVPNTPDYLVGILNLRGAIVPVVDLRRRFGLEAVDYQDRTVVIVVSVEEGERTRVVGIVVDGVPDVVGLAKEQIKTTPGNQSSIDPAFIVGLAQVDERVVMFIELDRLFVELWETKVVEGNQATTT